MEMRSTTTSVYDGFEVSHFDTDSQLKLYADSRRGQVEVADLMPSVSVKKLRSAISDNTLPASESYSVSTTSESEGTYEAPRSERTTRALGRGALSRMFKRVDAWISDKTMTVASKMWLAPSKEDLEERSQRHHDKYARKDSDSLFTAARKAAQRNRIKAGLYGAPLYALGYFALSKGTGSLHSMTGIDVVHNVSTVATDMYERASSTVTELYDEWTSPREVTLGQDLAANAIDYTPVETSFKEYKNKAILIGGRGDTHSTFLYDSLDAQGAIGDADLVVYPASIAPVDPVRMDVSADIAASGAANFYDPNSPSMQTIYGYSEGSAGAIDAYNGIVAANNGVKPDNLELVLIGSPYAQGGIFHSDYVGAAGPLLDAFGIPTDKQVPAGTTVIYSPNDFWANGDNQSFLGLASQLADLTGPGHDPDVTGPFHEWVDSDGVRHLVEADEEHALVEVAQKHGIILPPGASEVLQQIAPINNGMSDQVPQPNAYAAFDITADLIDRDTNSPIGSILMDNIPAPIKEVSQSGLELINNGPNTVAGMMNGTIPLQEGAQTLNDQADAFLQDAEQVFQDPVGTVTEMIDGAARDGIDQALIPLPPEQRAMAEPWAELGKKVLSDILDFKN